MLQIKKATKKNARLKMALIGISGSGKTYSALSIAQGLGERILVVDTEHGSASKYSDVFSFDVIELENMDPRNYIEAIQLAQKEGYDVLILDSLSHAWTGKGGALEQVDNAAKRSNGNSFGAWRNVTPLHNDLIDTIVGSRIHIIATMRAKTEYVQEKNERTGKTEVRKVGLAPVQRDQMEYEFDVVGDMTQDNDLLISKTRCPALTGQVYNRPGVQFAEILTSWLTDGVPNDAPSPQQPNASAEELQASPATDVQTKAMYIKACHLWGKQDAITELTQRFGDAQKLTEETANAAIQKMNEFAKAQESAAA